MNDEPTDDQLMRAFAGGDAAAFERLYQRHAGPLYRFVRRLLGSTAAMRGDEVFQDTWARVIGARDRWSPQGAAFRTWLFTIAHRLVIDVQRRSGREVAVDADADADTEPWSPADDGLHPWSGWPAPADDPGDQAFWRAAGVRLLECLDGLPAAQKAVFLLHHDDGVSLDDAAQALQLGFETVKSRLRYAMNKLRTCMGAYLPAALPAARGEKSA
jgi:RNA polymerase sigma factor (sigma-70 family)